MDPPQLLKIVIVQATTLCNPKIKMNVYIALACIIVVVSGMLTSTTASGFPLIYCPPNPSGLPAKIRKLCFAIVERVDTPQEEFSEGVELGNTLNRLHGASGGEGDGDGEVMDTQLFGRGTKRQDVDHVFLRFGRHLGL